MTEILSDACRNYHEHTLLMLSGLYIADQALEYWLGKTERVSAGSKVGLIFTALALLSAQFIRRKEDAKNTSINNR